MKKYIYFIINQVNGKRYVGQTSDFSRRKYTHLVKLRENRHENIKLQNAWNKYGEDSFVIEKITFENIDQKELDYQEKYYISKYNSIENGYNIVFGGKSGEGNNSRGKVTFEQYCYIYIGNKKHKGLMNKTAKKIGIDSSTVSHIVSEDSYQWYLERLLELSEEQKQEYLLKFEKDFDVINNPPTVWKKTLNNEDILKIICFVSTFGRGAEKQCLDYFGLSKGFVYHFAIGKNYELKDKYKSMTQEEIEKIGLDFANEAELGSGLKRKYTNLKDRYPNKF